MDADKELVCKLKDFNKKFSNKNAFLDKITDIVSKNIKESNGMIIRQMSKLLEKDIKNITKGNGIIGVDGSINTVGSSFPHYISIMKALAKCTDRTFEDIVLCDIHTPMLNEEDDILIEESISQVDRDEKIKAAKMARLELEAAYTAIQKTNVSLIMMDGSLIRYKISCGELWDDFVDLVLEKNIYVIGVIEEIKTKELYKILDVSSKDLQNIYDREILFGKLKVGEMVIINQTKESSDLCKCFMRTSNDPHVIGMDVLEQQKAKINELADLVYTLTAESGRGIPLWLDIVDSEVKITNSYAKALIDSHVDENIRRRFFSAKRDYRAL